MTTIRSLVFALGLVIAWAGSASAGGIASARFGGEGGTPASDSPTSIYYNPAGLAQSSGTRIYVEGLMIWRHATYERPEGAVSNIIEPGDTGTGTPRDALGANAGKAKLLNFIASPFLGAVSDLGVPNLAVGIAFYAPFGGQASWSQNDDFKDSQEYPGAVDGVQRWTAIDGVIRSLYLSGSIAYRLPGPRLSFGVTVSGVRSEIDTTRARLAAGEDHLVSGAGSITEGRARINVAANDVALGAGLQFQPTDALLIGVSYQSQPGLGEMKLKGALSTKFGAGPSGDQNIFLSQELPDVVRFGLRFRSSDSLELRLSGDFTRWSVLADQCLIARGQPDHTCKLDADGGSIDSDGDGTPDSTGVVLNAHRAWNDTFGVRAGASYWLSPAFELGGSLAFDSNAVPDNTIDPALMDMNKIVGSVGVVWSAMSNLRVLINYTQVAYLSRTIEPRAAPNPAPSKEPDSAGTYKQQVGLLALGVLYGF